MAVNVMMPNLGKTMKEGKILKWRYPEGGFVKEGDVIAEIETDKINYEIEAPISGILIKILVEEGDVAAAGQTIGILVADGETFESSALSVTDSDYPLREEGASSLPEGVEVDERIKITPIARRLAKEKGVDISQLKGSGPNGRITKEDVLAVAEAVKEKEAPLGAAVGLGMTLPLSRMREIIGERLTASSRDIPHIYFSCEVDGTEMIQFRDIFLPIIESSTGVRLSYNDIILKAAGTTLMKYPLLNASLEGKTIKIHPEVNIGLAVALEEGLVVPVIRRVHEKTLSQIAAARREILDKIDRKKLTLDDLSGGTFTVSNLGQFNIDFFTSIINPPETAILSVTKMKERPVAIKGELAIRPTFNLGLSVDHRVVDGAMGAKFLQELQRLLQTPYLMCQV